MASSTTLSVKTSLAGVLVLNLLLLLFLPPAHGAISGEQIRQRVVQHIERSMPWPKEAARIDVDTPPDISVLAKDGLLIRVETVGSEEYVGAMTFMVRLSDGKQHRQVTVHGRVEIEREVVVSARPLARDAVIMAEDVKIKKKWVRHFDPDLSSSMDRVIGKRVVMGVRAGAELKSQMLREPVIVKKGKTVRISLERGAMSLTTMGISEEDGSQGATIRVRNMSSNRLVYARVTGENTVRIDY